MRVRALATILGTALVGAGLTALVIARPADAAGAGDRLFLHGTSAEYAEDAALDPTAGLEGRAPDGAFADTTPPTGTTSKTGISAEPTGSPGLPVAPTFTVPFQGSLTTACIDVFVEGLPDSGSFLLYVAFGKGDPTESGVWTYPPATLTDGSGITRVTTLLKMDAAFPMVEGATVFFYVSSFELGPDSRPFVVYYDSVEHPSNVTMNPTGACTPFGGGGGGAPAPTGAASASAEPSAAPSESAAASAAPSESAAPDPSPTQPVASCAPASPSPAASASAEPSAEPSADASASAAVAPKLPLPPGGSATPSASADPSESAAASAEPSPTSGGGGGNDDACAAGSITLATNATRVTAGNAPTLTGIVRNFRGDAVDGVTVTIYVRGYGEARYSSAATVRTDDAGRFTLQVRPMKQSAFVAGVGEKRSPTLAIRVNTRMDISSPGANSVVANPVTFTGRMTPGYARVPVGLGYLVNGRFVVLTQANTTGTGTYAVPARLPRGTYAFVVFTSAHQGTDKGSRSVRLTVR